MAAPDDPTRRIPPDEVPPPRVTEREYVAPDPDVDWRREILDRLDSLRTWVAIATVLSLLALGLAGYTLLTAEEEDDAQRGATRSQVDRLENRIDDVEEQVGDVPSDDAVAELRAGQRDLEDRVQAAEDAAEESADAETVDPDQLQQSLDELSAAIEELDQRVSQVEQQQTEQP